MKRVVCAGALAAMALVGGADARAENEAPAPVVAADPLGLEAVLRSVDERYPLLLAAIEDVNAAEGEQLAADGGFDPSWKTKASAYPAGGYQNFRAETGLEQPTGLWGTRFFAGYRVGYGDFAIYDGKARTNDYGEARLGATVPLLRDGSIDRRRATIRRAELAADIARLSVRQQRIELARVASAKYWDWVGAGRRLSVALQLLNIATGRDDGIQRRVARGDVPNYEHIENVRAIQQRQGAVVSATRSLQQASIELSLYFRDERGEPIVLSDVRLPTSLPEPSGALVAPQEAERLALARRPDNQRADLQREQQRVELTLAENQRLPAIDLTLAGVQGFGPTTPTLSTIVDYPDIDNANKKLNKTGFEASLFIDIPLLNRTASGKRDAAEASLRRITEQARYTRDKIVAEVRDATSAMVQARRRLEAVRAEVRAADELATLEERRFDLGDSTLLIVNLRETAAAESHIKEVDALVDYHKAEANYRAATAWGDAGNRSAPARR
jgi:cobalt-zinc-cadmium efflux system outer membrane protein